MACEYVCAGGASIVRFRLMDAPRCRKMVILFAPPLPELESSTKSKDYRLNPIGVGPDVGKGARNAALIQALRGEGRAAGSRTFHSRTEVTFGTLVYEIHI